MENEKFITSDVWVDIFSAMIDGVDCLASAETCMSEHLVKEFSDGNACMFILEPISEDESESMIEWLKELSEDEPEFWLGEEEMKEHFSYLFPSEEPYELWGDKCYVNMNVEFTPNRRIVGYQHKNPIYDYSNNDKNVKIVVIDNEPRYRRDDWGREIIPRHTENQKWTGYYDDWGNPIYR